MTYLHTVQRNISQKYPLCCNGNLDSCILDVTFLTKSTQGILREEGTEKRCCFRVMFRNFAGLFLSKEILQLHDSIIQMFMIIISMKALH